MNDKLSILAEMDASRAAIARDYRLLAEELDVKQRVAKAVKRSPRVWVGAAAFAGFVVSGLARLPSKILRGGKAKRSSSGSKSSLAGLTFWGVLFALVKIAIPFVRPLVSAYAAKGLTNLAGSYLNKKKG